MSSADRGEAAFGIAPPEPSQAPPVDPDETIFIAQPQPQMTDADAEQHYGQRQSVLRRRKTEAAGDDPVVLPPIEKQSNRTVAQAGAAATSDASAHRLLGALLDSSSTREFGSSFRFLLEDLNPLNPLSASSAGGSNKVHVRIPQARSDRPSTAGSSGRDGPPIDASRDDSKERRAMADDEPSLSASRSPSPSKKALQLVRRLPCSCPLPLLHFTHLIMLYAGRISQESGGRERRAQVPAAAQRRPPAAALLHRGQVTHGPSRFYIHARSCFHAVAWLLVSPKLHWSSRVMYMFAARHPHSMPHPH